jgi:MFS family permease
LLDESYYINTIDNREKEILIIDDFDQVVMYNDIFVDRSHSIITDSNTKTLDTAIATPWKSFLTHPTSLTYLFCSFTIGWNGYLLLTEFPSYLHSVLGFDLQTSGLLCIIPYSVLFIMCISFGYLFNYLEHKKQWSIKSIRQTAQTVALSSSVFLVICGVIHNQNKWLAFIFMVLANGLLGASPSGLSCSLLDVAPNYASVFVSLCNTCGAFAGIIAPLICSALIENMGPSKGWIATFLLTLMIDTFTLIFWFKYLVTTIIPELNNPPESKFI